MHYRIGKTFSAAWNSTKNPMWKAMKEVLKLQNFPYGGSWCLKYSFQATFLNELPKHIESMQNYATEER